MTVSIVAADSASASVQLERVPQRAVFYARKEIARIYPVFEPNVFIADFDGLTVASTHGYHGATAPSCR